MPALNTAWKAELGRAAVKKQKGWQKCNFPCAHSFSCQAVNLVLQKGSLSSLKDPLKCFTVVTFSLMWTPAEFTGAKNQQSNQVEWAVLASKGHLFIKVSESWCHAVAVQVAQT